ncbi:hypothetical protein ACRALDRAFT_210879 [Sodiomyces alcalophilus JCM 7366]|uniref:uncharacterized protein n=1 Tax=Sodiomyces alcalophilus JCM 7366 TaxID=591952 RepID=UPI0039B3A1EF
MGKLDIQTITQNDDDQRRERGDKGQSEPDVGNAYSVLDINQGQRVRNKLRMSTYEYIGSTVLPRHSRVEGIRPTYWPSHQTPRGVEARQAFRSIKQQRWMNPPSQACPPPPLLWIVEELFNFCPAAVDRFPLDKDGQAPVQIPANTPDNNLLTLPRVDRRNDNNFGIHHGTALLACQVVAGNAFDGYLSLNKGGEAVSVPLDGILTQGSYYFSFTPSIEDIWPDIPPGGRHDRCVVSNFSFAVENAHLIPKEERTWFQKNEMDLYGYGLTGINDEANLLPMKSDIHVCFDKRWFVIVPKTASTISSEPQYVTHIISPEAEEFSPIYQDTIVRPRTRSKHFLFVRFAWAILLRAKPFLLRDEKRWVLQVSGVDEDGKLQHVREEMSGQRLQQIYGGGGSCSATPMKRSRDTSLVMDEDDVGVLSDLPDEEPDPVWDFVGMSHNNNRRQQNSSEETGVDIGPVVNGWAWIVGLHKNAWGCYVKLEAIGNHSFTK